MNWLQAWRENASLYRCHCLHLENLCADWHFLPADKVWVAYATRLSTQSVFPRPQAKRDKEHLMSDVVMLAIGLSFFVASVGYAYASARL
jgi:hypothetical protein